MNNFDLDFSMDMIILGFFKKRGIYSSHCKVLKISLLLVFLSFCGAYKCNNNAERSFDFGNYDFVRRNGMISDSKDDASRIQATI